ncbi:MAG: VapC toxin family PIN domain ribonuclease [Devosia sp. 67-54]|uniref:type II toxin-antitoxin system VapC family toxin n=1 Tax=unclassified Devosia TaxID=196773 RepID=UPI0009602551|nr:MULTISPECIES: PIN domain-containing protein [unclassified Devosia]MBN9307125.1 PIN domain-containing protein [Devosia sp.]OJX19525.1 MAG: VapC toxin family PIN domain ribonuclease [Devosia sp. 67-54]
MIVADSSVWIDNIRQRDTRQVRQLRASDQGEIIAGDVVVLEVLRGVRSEREALIQEARFRAYGITPMVDAEIAALAARHFRTLRAIGITIRSSVDLIVATYCLMHGHSLLHNDRDFDHFERHLGLRVVR